MDDQAVFSDCQVCSDLWRLFSDSDFHQDINLGSFEQALASSCPRHVELVKRFHDHCSGSIRVSQHDIKDLGIRRRSKSSSVQMIQSLSKLGVVWHMLLVNRDTSPNHPGHGRILDPQWADLDVARQWLTTCLNEHGAKCDNPLKVAPSPPAWLIDVENKCLVPGEEHPDFIALSYRYGESLRLVLGQDTMRQLQERNALDTPEIAAQVTPIVRHAIHLTATLGERYLWVDALCIVRPDRETSNDVLRLMGTVYASARMTIVAADDDAQTGLLGLSDVSEPRQLEQKTISFGDEKIAVRNTGMFSMGSGTPYYRRGWTYQEYKLSRRRLLFNRKELHWECSCCVWHEETTLRTQVDAYIDPRLGVLVDGLPDLASLSHIVTTYNEKQLTFDEDALPGILGLLDTVGRPFEGGFLYGIPEMFFERGLGWQPMWGHTNLRRREPSTSTNDRSRWPSALPSWSWIGWQGTVAYYSEAWRINDRAPRIEETYPITEWYTGTAPDDPNPRKIRSTWWSHRDTLKNCSEDLLPSGWTRHPAPASTDPIPQSIWLRPDSCGPHVYKHSSMADDADCNTFYYPYPIPPITPTTPFSSPAQTPYLSCHTQRAFLWARRATAGQRYKAHALEICDSAVDGAKIGELHAANDQQFEFFPPVPSSVEATTVTAGAVQVELAVVYRYKTWSKFDLDDPSRTPDQRFAPYTAERYRVLWIEWRDGVAYRLACGWVEREHWEAQKLLDVKLVLG